MKIVQINTYDIRGGAARAAYRLHEGLLKIGQESQVLVVQKFANDETVYRVNLKEGEKSFEEQLFFGAAIQEHYIDAHRTEISNTLFSLPYPGYDLSSLPMLKEAEVINLHWVAYYQSTATLRSLFALRKPVVWTLHDQWAFTGGCHYTAGCQKYRRDCVACPQLAEDPFNLAAVILKDKLELFKGANLTIVTPSLWLADCAKQSKLFKELRVEVIPYGLDTDIFAPLPKAKAKKRLGIEADVVTLLFVAEQSAEKRKGFQELLAAMQHCFYNAEFQELVQGERIKLLCLGHSDYKADSLRIPAVFLGYLDSEEEIRTAYAAADLFILPSLEDNLPNTILESMSCGTPVVAFDVGGVPDVVTNGVTGQLVYPGDVSQMGEAIVSLVLNPELRKEMGKRCRKNMIEKNSLTDQAERYGQLYQMLYQDDKLSGRKPSEYSTLEVETGDAEIASTTALVSVGTMKGPHFSDIFDQVLLKALKEFSLVKEQAYQASEDDRAARLKVIEEQGRRLGEVEAERNNLQSELAHWRQHFESVQAESAARLQVIEEQGRRLGEVEAERDKLQSERDGALQVLFTVSRTRAYKLLRRLGRWKAIEQSISEISEGLLAPAGYTEVEMSLLERLGPGQLVNLIAKAYANVDSLFSTCEEHGLHLTPVHFYSPIPEVSKLPKKIWEQSSELIGIEINEQAQLAFLNQICHNYKSEYEAFPVNPTDVPYQYYFNQMMFRSVDAEVLYCMIRYHCPRRVIEVGSGFSTYVAAAAVVRNAEQGKPAEFVAIEPYPDEVLRKGFPGLQRLISEPVQDVDLNLFTTLMEGDVLFIDSSHVLRIDSDVRFLFLEVLPRLQPGVLVHFHDIFLPLDYPPEWVMKEHRFWNEQYLLQAFLAFNRAFEVIWAGSFMHQSHSDTLKKAFSHYEPRTVTPGSFWTRYVIS